MTGLWVVLSVMVLFAAAGAGWHGCGVCPPLADESREHGCEHPSHAPRRQGTGDRGLVIFVESIRWLGVRWGASTVERGLRQGGFEGRFLYWQWHAGWRAWLVLPALMDRGMLEREAGRLADFIAARRRDHPDMPLYLMGYSAGGFVAVRALELLDDDVRVDAAALLEAAFSPGRDLGAACRHLDGPLVICSSVADCLIVGLGTLLFGTADRRHAFSIGMIGPRGRAAADPRVRLLPWRPGLVRSGHWGGHFGASACGFIRHCVAPAMGIAAQPT